VRVVFANRAEWDRVRRWARADREAFAAEARHRICEWDTADWLEARKLAAARGVPAPKRSRPSSPVDRPREPRGQLHVRSPF
jgi:hypothetical protein